MALLRLPPLPQVPASLAGRLSVAVRFAYVGDPAHGGALVRQIRNSGAVLLDGVDEMPYAAVDAIHADPVDPMPTHEAYGLLRDLTADGVDELLRLAGPACDSPLLMLELRPLAWTVRSSGGTRTAPPSGSPTPALP